MINTNVKKQYPVIRMPNGHPVSSTMYNRGDLHGVVYSNDIEFDDVLLSNVITTSTVIANLNVSTTVSSNILSSGLLLGSVTVSKLVNSAISTTSNITADAKLAYNLLSSLTTLSSVVGNLTIPKLVNTSLVSTGTIVADLSVSSATSSLLLDTYPNAAAAYSLRKLRTAYTGSAIRVRRSSDNTEQNIGFTGNELDTTALLSFCGAGNGFVTTWYDQSGNARNATQITQANQPQIVSSGVVILVNSKAALKFDGSSQTVRTNSSVISTDFSVFGVAQKPENNENGLLFTQYDTFDDSRTLFGSEGLGTRLIGIQIGAGFDSKLGTPSYLQKLYYYNRNGATIDYADNNSLVNTYQNNRVCQNAALSFSGFTGNFFKINIQELVIYSNSNSSNRGNISNNINTHYGIY